MAESMQSLEELGTLKPAAPEAPKYTQKLFPLLNATISPA